MRIIFIAGMGEDETIFDNIAPHIAGDQLILSSWKIIPDEPWNDINGLSFARSFIARYNITKEDVLIGHSMGGWIAWFVKHYTGCTVIQVSSLTNTDRLVLPLGNIPLVYWAIRAGFAFNVFTKWLLSVVQYNYRPSKYIYRYIMDLFIHGNRQNTVNQLRLILNPVPEKITVQPDLRIHGSNNSILKPPKEPYVQVPGDHFSLYTFPAKVYEPINKFLQKQDK